MRIGAQFFTLREHCGNLDSFALSLRKVADMGYQFVQISGTCGYSPEWLKEQLEKNGLRCVLTHTPGQRLINDTEQVCTEHKIFGCSYIGLGRHLFEPENGDHGYRAFMENYLPVAQTFKKNGQYFVYHNHDREFAKLNGKTILQRLMEDIPADTMGFTLDTFWVQAGGGDPGQWLEKLSGRVPCIHLKDFGYGRKMLPIGEGNMNFDRIFEKADACGVQYMLVEQDDCNGEDPFDCLRRSYQYLNACGLK